jgi:hypothetical protein
MIIPWNGKGEISVKEAQEEKYYSSLNSIINRYNKTHFNQAVAPDDQYTSSLAEFIMAAYPRLTQNILNGSIYTIPKTPFAERIIPAIVNAAAKGTVVSVRDARGKLKIYANAGKDNKGNKKRILIIDGHEKDADKKNHRRFMAYHILKDDIQYVFRNEKYLRTKRPPQGIPALEENRAQVTPRGKFERQFKALIREQGSGSSPNLTAQYIFTTMAYSDKKKLNRSFEAMGVKTSIDMGKILQRWKSEALRERPLPARAPSREFQGYGR